MRLTLSLGITRTIQPIFVFLVKRQWDICLEFGAQILNFMATMLSYFSNEEILDFYLN